MYDLESLGDIVPPLPCQYDEMDPRSATYFKKLDHAIDMAMCAQDGNVSFEEASKAIYGWIEISQTFFADPPPIVAGIEIGRYVEVHNRLLSAAMAAASAEKFEWPPRS